MMSRLFHVSDLHFGCSDGVALDWFASLVRAEKPDAVLVTGDLTMRARTREFAAANEWLLSLGVPVTLEPGNHDLPYFNPIERFIAPYRRFRAVEKNIERPIALKDVWLVPLKTTRRAQWRLDWSRGAVSHSSLQGALQRLSRKPDGCLAIVTCHHPLMDSEVITARSRTTDGMAALKRLSEAGAHAVLSGHVHDPFCIRWSDGERSINLIGAGTLSTRQRGSPPSFNELVVTAGQLEVYARTLNS
jgi:3',5'-cyclic AMP phosphodiesterase CpdA